MDRKDSREQLTELAGKSGGVASSVVSDTRKFLLQPPAPPRHHCEITGQHTSPSLPQPSPTIPTQDTQFHSSENQFRLQTFFKFSFFIYYLLPVKPRLQNLSSNLSTENGDIKLFRIF